MCFTMKCNNLLQTIKLTLNEFSLTDVNIINLNLFFVSTGIENTIELNCFMCYTLY